MSPRKPLAALLTLLITPLASAFLYSPSQVPDALKKADAWIKDHPDRPEGYFFRGAANASAWAKGTTGKNTSLDVISFGDAERPPAFAPWYSIMFDRDPAQKITPDSLQYLADSITNYRKAIALDPKNPRYQLALAWSLEQAASADLQPTDSTATAPHPLTPEEKNQCDTALALLDNPDFKKREAATKLLTTLMPNDAESLLAVKSNAPEITARIHSILAAYWLTDAAKHYRIAYDLSLDKDLAAKQYDPEADNTITIKAGERLLALAPNDPAAKPEETKHLKETLDIIKAKPPMGHVY